MQRSQTVMKMRRNLKKMKRLREKRTHLGHIPPSQLECSFLLWIGGRWPLHRQI
jgi:hypothetical protein